LWQQVVHQIVYLVLSKYYGNLGVWIPVLGFDGSQKKIFGNLVKREPSFLGLKF